MRGLSRFSGGRFEGSADEGGDGGYVWFAQERYERIPGVPNLAT